MATTPQNNKKYDLGPVDNYFPAAIVASQAINQGDLCWFDETTRTAKVLDTDAHASKFIGVADRTNQVTSLNVDIKPLEMNFVSGAVFEFSGTAGQTYSHGEAVYIGATAQTITRTAGSNAIGYVCFRDGITTLATQNGKIPVYIVANYPTSRP